MHWFRSLLVAFVVCVPLLLRAQPPAAGPVKQPRILILVDASSSMLQPWKNGKSRFEMAGALVEKLIDSVYSVNDQVEFGLRVYGHLSPAQENDCYDSRREVMFSKDNFTQMSLRMASLHPRGVSPIAYSIRLAAEEDMTDENNYSYSLILITDGGESCGGDICAVARELLAKKIFFKPYILSLVDYAPLRQQYDCLGQYLQVTKDADLPVAVGTIVDAYRKSLILAKASNKEVKTTPVPISVPSVLHIPAPPVTLPQREPEDVPAIQPSKPAASAPATPVREQPKPVAMEPLPRIINREELARIATVTHMHLLPLHFGTTSPQPLKIPPMPPVKAEPEPVAATLPPAAPPSRPPAASAPPKVTPKPTVIRRAGTSSVSASPDPTKPLEAEYTATAEQAQESAVEVYFTDGKGNFYKSAPQLLINDAKTGKNQKKFYRSVDALGNPEPEPLAPGTYNIVVAGRTNLVAKNVTINPNEKKKVYIKVGKSTIRFRYEGNPNRPVTEFEALISKLFEPGPAIRQHCTAELEYEPGTYRIEINTVPVTRYSLDIEFNASYFVTIDEPGYVQFTNQNAIGKVSLYHPLNDAFVRFLSVNITGNPQDQKVQLQPGLYEAHWVKDPSLPYASESIVRFQVRSNDVTNTELQ